MKFPFLSGSGQRELRANKGSQLKRSFLFAVAFIFKNSRKKQKRKSSKKYLLEKNKNKNSKKINTT